VRGIDDNLFPSSHISWHFPAPSCGPGQRL